jgi:hypothetical protein
VNTGKRPTYLRHWYNDPLENQYSSVCLVPRMHDEEKKRKKRKKGLMNKIENLFDSSNADYFSKVTFFVSSLTEAKI